MSSDGVCSTVQGLKPGYYCRFDVAAEAATHKALYGLTEDFYLAGF